MATQSPSTTRIDRRWINTAFFLLIVLAVVAGFAALWWVTTLPRRVDEQQTIVVGRTRFAPDSEGSVRVVVQDFGRGEPIAGAQVLVSLKPETGRAIPLYEGETDATGSVPVSFHVPADVPSDATLVVETHSSVGRDVVEQPVTVEREYRLLLTSDKPLYQPGQVIHMRALALSTFDLTPARGATVNFLVEDSKGNKVFRQSVEASDFGIAAADFALADLVNQGNYKLSVAIGDAVESQTRSEKTVEVRPYVLPKFDVSVSTDRSFYLPGQRVEGVVQADYFFGKPVADSEVRVVGSVWDVEHTVVVDLQGQTDENGTYEFGFDLPEYFAGSGLDSGQAQFALEVTVIDQTDHPEQTSTVIPVAAQPLIIEVVAESGRTQGVRVLKPGVENIVYILTAYPDGRPAKTQLQVSVDGGEPTELASGEFGLAEFTFTPQANSAPWLRIMAQDETGLEASRDVSFETEVGSDSVLLRADRAAYFVGETMNLTALTPVASGSVYLDIVRTGQTLSTRSVQVESGKAEFAVDVSPDMYGTLELHAYKVLLDGTIVRDTRVVVVDAPNELAIGVSADKETYLPGEGATIDFRVGEQGSEGAGVQAALGVAIVDESVFALQRQDPGFAKLYFMLEQELMEPFYQVKGFELPAAIPPDDEEVRLAQDDAAKAAVAKATWADVSAAAVQPVNSRYEKLSAVDEAQFTGFTRISRGAVVGMILVPLGLWAVAIVALVRSGVVKRALVRLAIAFGIVVVGSCLLSGWLFTLMNEFYYFDFEVLLIPLGLIFGAGVLGVGIYAWVKRDPAAKFFTLLTLAWPALLLLLFLASDRGGEPSEMLTVIALVALALVPGVYLLFGQMRWAQKRRVVGGIATGLGALLALPVMVVLLTGLLAFGAMPMMTGARTPMADGEWGVEEGEAVRQVEKEMEALPGAPTPIPDTVGGDESAVEGKEAPRLRQYFPETLYWAPEVLTDEGGYASLEIPMADSITTWRLTALASSQDGRLGFTTRGVRVFQDFFVDIDLPVSLTQGDEISIPVGVFNYLPEAQEVRLEVQEENWFELLGDKEQTLTIVSNDIEVVYFPIRVLDFGRQGFQVTAWGEMMSDAIRREVAVVPDGKEFRSTESDWLRESKQVSLDIPAEVVPGTPTVEVKIYPGVMAQAVEGLEKILRLPHG
jgi:5-hydroxyisourate hydrolase-like protein (transthyretin family)